MGKRQSKTAIVVSPTKASQDKMAQASTLLPEKYLLVVKTSWCGACKGLQAMFDQLQTKGQLNVNPFVVAIWDPKSGEERKPGEVTWEEVLRNPQYSRLIRRGYGFQKEKPGPIPFMMIVRRNKVAKADTKLGGFRNVDALQTFLQRF